MGIDHIYSSYINILLLNNENTWELPLVINGHIVCDIVYGVGHDNLIALLFDNINKNNQGMLNHFKVRASTCLSFFMALCNAHLKCILALYIVCLYSWLMLLLMKPIFLHECQLILARLLGRKFWSKGLKKDALEIVEIYHIVGLSRR